MIYFDNSATTLFKPDSVIEAVTHSLRHNSGNPGRSGHKAAINASMVILNARKTISEMFGAEEDRIIFTSGCTEALNLAILGNIRTGHVVTTALEHNSVLRPLYELERLKRITLTVLNPNKDGIVTPRMIEESITPSTYLVAVNHVSNVTGAENPVGEIGRMLKRTRILFLVDAAQSAGYLPIDICELNIDMLAIAGHKGLHGPQGIGALLLSERISTLTPIKFGGTGTSSESVYQPDTFPEGFESGTPATPLIAGLDAALHFSKENMKKTGLMRQLTARLLGNIEKISKVELYTPKRAISGVVTFNIEGFSSPEICDILDNQYDIAVRGGLHCAPLIHKHLGTTERGAVRISLSTENTIAEVDALLDAIYEIAHS